MPECPIIDAHLHLWDPQRLPIDWVVGDPVLNRAYTLADFDAHTTGLPVVGAVYVQVGVAPAYALVEAREIAALDATRVQGIVAYAPLEDGVRARSYLDALADVPRVCGVRRIIQDDGDSQICLAPDFVAGVALLAERDWVFDLCIRAPQLPAATELVRRLPQVRFVLDHIGKPAIRNGDLDPWRADLRALAALPNVVCKISGVATEADLHSWTHADLAPYIAHAIESFGPERVLFGGDWPVALLATEYRRWVETLDLLIGELSSTARVAFWADNARRVYRLGLR